MSLPELGAKVIVKGNHGIVRFVGKTEFSNGEWVGIELDHPAGKNDGAVAGVRYFSCSDRYGLFVRPELLDLDNSAVLNKDRQTPTLLPISPSKVSDTIMFNSSIY